MREFLDFLEKVSDLSPGGGLVLVCVVALLVALRAIGLAEKTLDQPRRKR